MHMLGCRPLAAASLLLQASDRNVRQHIMRRVGLQASSELHAWRAGGPGDAPCNSMHTSSCQTAHAAACATHTTCSSSCMQRTRHASLPVVKRSIAAAASSLPVSRLGAGTEPSGQLQGRTTSLTARSASTDAASTGARTASGGTAPQPFIPMLVPVAGSQGLGMQGAAAAAAAPVAPRKRKLGEACLSWDPALGVAACRVPSRGPIPVPLKQLPERDLQGAL